MRAIELLYRWKTGGPNFLMIGSPGSGKTMLVKTRILEHPDHAGLSVDPG